MITTLSTRTEARLFRAGSALLGLRVLDDTVLQPPAGVPVTDRPFAALVPLALLAVAAWAYPRLRGTARGALALLLGVLGVATGLDAVYYTSELGLSSDDVTGWLALPATLGLIGLGTGTLWRTLRRGGRRLARRTALGVGLLVTAFIAVLPVGVAYVHSHTARAVVPENRMGVPVRDVTFTSTDGLKLQGWYAPSRNGAAVIVFPGRKGPQAQARMLARHGYGVLLFDRRGEGRSEGQPNGWGWGGGRDVKGAIAFLERQGVDRIGGLGLSVGGELMLQVAAETPALDAVVSEGAGARTMGDELDADLRWYDHVGAAISYGLRDLTLAIETGETPPRRLDGLVEQLRQPALLIAAPNSPNGERLNRRYTQGSNAELWEIPESAHIGGLRARPAEYERRVVGFFDRSL
ncbi:hypothetical protein OJ997_06800 [Solirubrobacter phytolaccae]|uniref:Xaa-Pro dipeptidyl-peptidase-like domain-containing protein n=1 Tax=Solirubrobacter phytolaccae TaxID=1404360 RepID=A0A9X3NCA9_9ACTN|nr:alpha/beta fold hydrolase [Solirubrobacter phytolaccae]MDA0179997.1 hypothetical protein [Solirubrobacter phytolaccae]